MTGVSGEANLVVDHHVDGAVCGVGREVREVEGLVDHSLSSEGCIAVQQYTHHFAAFSVFTVELFCTRLALHHWVHSWERQERGRGEGRKDRQGRGRGGAKEGQGRGRGGARKGQGKGRGRGWAGRRRGEGVVCQYQWARQPSLPPWAASLSPNPPSKCEGLATTASLMTCSLPSAPTQGTSLHMPR